MKKYPILERLSEDNIFCLRPNDGTYRDTIDFVITERNLGFYDFPLTRAELLALAKEIEEFANHSA